MRALVFLFFPLIFTAVAHADSEPSLCGDAFLAVCKQPLLTKVPEQVSKEIELEASRQVNLYLSTSFSPDHFVDDLKSDLVHHPSHATQTRSLLYLSCLDYLSRARFSGESPKPCFNGKRDGTGEDSIEKILDELNDRHFDKVDRVLLRAKALVEAVVQDSTLSLALKDEIVTLVQKAPMTNVVAGTKTDLEQVSPRDLAKDPEALLKAAEAHCEFDLSVVNAFWDGDALLTCPSFWTSAMRTKTESDEYRLFFILTHELGHAVEEYIEITSSSGVLPLLGRETSELRKSAISCVGERYIRSGDLAIEYDTHFSSDSAKKDFMAKLLALTNDKKASFFYREYFADSISSQALSSFFEKLPDEVNRSDEFRLNLQSLCSDETLDESRKSEPIDPKAFYDEDLHPATAFRIQEGLLGNEALRHALGCASRETPPNCKFISPAN